MALKFCTQCDKGKAEQFDEKRRCIWCNFLSCENCLPPGQLVCNHCTEYNQSYKDMKDLI